jgi:hypothetical protein
MGTAMMIARLLWAAWTWCPPVRDEPGRRFEVEARAALRDWLML